MPHRPDNQPDLEAFIPRWNAATNTGESIVMPAADFCRVREALKSLATLHQFGERLMGSEVMEEFGPHHYTPEQQAFIRRVVAEREPPPEPSPLSADYGPGEDWALKDTDL